MSKALIAGSTGLCGNELFQLLLASEHFEKIYILTRKPLDITSTKVVEIRSDFSNIASDLSSVEVDFVYCCLGTTIAKAGSQEKFNLVDNIYVRNLADWAEQKHASYFGVISSMGADVSSRIFYSRVKGEMEAYVQGKNMPHISIYRPSMLLGARKEKRFGERMAQILMTMVKPLIRLLMPAYQAIEAKTVASAMYHESLSNAAGKHIYMNRDLFKLAL